jgi:ligand-binding sensor domain-containing protein
VTVLRPGGVLERFDEARGLMGEVVNDLAIDSRGVPWVATPEGLGHYQQNTWRFFLDNQPENLHVNSLAVDAAGELWTGGNRGAIHYDGRRWEVFSSTRGGLISNRIRSVHVDGQNRVWFVTEAGISMLTRR